ncbi:hypothetical protein TWF506_003112 [Arthrobotrys conoides]|uniref:Uncharacterized protein n=1 Tax=Arthrobotrys conoides TaxID=74498 RepID=A0AAN8NC82_9PEZI
MSLVLGYSWLKGTVLPFSNNVMQGRPIFAFILHDASSDITYESPKRCAPVLKRVWSCFWDRPCRESEGLLWSIRRLPELTAPKPPGILERTGNKSTSPQVLAFAVITFSRS